MWAGLHRFLETSGEDRAAALRQYHQERLQLLSERAVQQGIFEAVAERPWSRPTAEQAAPLAMTKSFNEVAILRQLEPGAALRILTPQQWLAIGEREMDEVIFAPAAIALMRRKQTITPELLNNLRRTVASDTAFNESELHRQVHQWFIDGEVRDLESLNERVYRDLFLTPSDDPWMGLKQPGVFTAMGL